jgi:Glycosyl hydrolase family 79 C-terminal beta domain
MRLLALVAAAIAVVAVGALGLVPAGPASAGPASAEQVPPPTGPSSTTPSPTSTTPAPTTTPPITPVATSVPATVTVSTTGRLVSVPSSFLGFSTEYWALPIDASYSTVFARILADVAVPGQGLVLRIGGDSADQTFWEPSVSAYPIWAYGLTAAWMQQAAALIAADHLHVILDVNHISGTPQLAAALVSEAEQTFPAGSITGIEIGNEPDVYTQPGWQAFVGGSTVGPFGEADLPPAITPASYRATFAAFAGALAPVAPNVPLMGPALAIPQFGLSWIKALAEPSQPGLGAITMHEYPFGDCGDPTGPVYPSVAGLLNRHAVLNVFSSLRLDALQAQWEGLPLRVTEFNSVTCGGVAGVSDSFATALWAPGALFEMLSAGVSSADLHLRTTTINAPFVYDGGGVDVRPLLYGLILFQRMLGPGAQLANATVTDDAKLGLSAWAVQVAGDRLNVLLLDKDPRAARVRLDVPSGIDATVQTLTAPSANASSDVTLDGQQLDSQADWVGTPLTRTITGSGGVFHVRVRGISATLVSIAGA